MATRFLGQYSVILRRPGAVRFVIAGWLGRMARSTSGISTILLVSGVAHSYGLAGGVSAAIILGIGVCSPLWSRATDRYGQSRVLPWGIAGTAAAAIALATTVGLGAPAWAWFASAFLVGATSIDAGSLVRARWAGTLNSVGGTHTALSLEAVLDELTFVVGPPLVTVLASFGGPILGFAVGIGIALAGQVWLLSQRATAPAVRAAIGLARRGLPRGVLGLLPVYAGVGVVFGSIDIGAVSVARSVDNSSLAGLILALFSIGSVLAGIAFGPLSANWLPARRVLVAAIAFGIIIPSLSLVRDATVLVIVIGFAGFMTTPMLISGVSFIESRVERHRLTEALGWPSVGLSAGVVAGSTIAGIAVDNGTPFSAYTVAAVGAAVVGVFGIVASLADRSRHPETAELQTVD